MRVRLPPPALQLTVDDVMGEARDKEIESLDEIRFAVLEPGGKMTFIKK